MSVSLKRTNTSARQVLMVNSSNRKTGLKDTPGSKKASDTQARAGTVRCDILSQEATDKSIRNAIESDTRKPSVSRRRISSSITPQASPRMCRKAGAEKENAKVENTPLRAPMVRSATSTLRRKPVPHTGSVPLKTLQLVSRSQSLQAPQLSRASRSNLHERVSALARQSTITKTRSTLSLGVGVKDKGDVTTTGRTRATAKPLLASASVKAEVDTTRLSQENAAIQPKESQDVIIPNDSAKLNSATAIFNLSDVPTTPSTPGSTPGIQTPSSVSLSQPLEPLQLQGTSVSAPLQAPMGFSSPIEAHIDEQYISSFERLSTLSSLGSLFDLAEDTTKVNSDPTQTVEKENSFELVHLLSPSRHSQQDLLSVTSKKEENSNVDTKETSLVAASESTTSACPGEPFDKVVSEAPLPSPSICAEIEKPSFVNSTPDTRQEDEDEQEAKVDFKPADPKEVPRLSLSSDSKVTLELEHTDTAKLASSKSETEESSIALALDFGSAKTMHAYTEFTNTKEADNQVSTTLAEAQLASIPPAPPSSPIQNAYPSTAAEASSLPASFFPRLFTELASTYSHLGFAAFSAGAGIPVPALDPQATRTQKELASLRAGAGSVLARARVFGQTLWSPSTALTHVQEAECVPEGVTKTKADESDEGSGNAVQVSSSSESDGTLPTSPTASTGGKRTLGCADTLRAVAMAQRLWTTKNFQLE